MQLASLDLSQESLGEVIASTLGTVYPKGMIRLPKTLKHVIWVDLREGNLYVFKRAGDEFSLVETMSVSIGKMVTARFSRVIKGHRLACIA